MIYQLPNILSYLQVRQVQDADSGMAKLHRHIETCSSGKGFHAVEWRGKWYFEANGFEYFEFRQIHRVRSIRVFLVQKAKSFYDLRSRRNH